MDISQEFISKVMLGIKYDTKKTLSENKNEISLFEQNEFPNFNDYIGDSNKKTVKLTYQKSAEEIKKEKEGLLKKQAEEYKKTPRGYAESLGYKDWKLLQSLFCCPTYKENKNENIKCNLNIKKALEQSWKVGDEVPKNLKSSYCEDNQTNGDEKKQKNDVNGEQNKDNNNNKDDRPNDHKNYGDPNPNTEEIPGLTHAKFDGDFNDWFNSSFIYPEIAEKQGIEGVVNVTFFIDIDGSIINTYTDNKSNPILSNYAKKLIDSMPKWIPAEKYGNKIKTKIDLPINFTLE